MAPSSANPPSLPPTVEEAYRRKCIQLKERTKEIEDENDAYRLRITRLRRQVQKLRLERAFLLEQIQKRTSTNVEDSDGSPSPPPTPEDKPLRIKRGHRKISSTLRTAESPAPSENSLSHADASFTAESGAAVGRSRSRDHARNGTTSHSVPPPSKPPKRPSNAFEIYSNDMRPVLQAEHKEEIAAGEYQLEQELARGWKDLDEASKDQYQTRYAAELEKWKEDREAYRRRAKEASGGGSSRRDRAQARPYIVRASFAKTYPLDPEPSEYSSEQDPDHDEDVSVDIEMGDADNGVADSKDHDEHSKHEHDGNDTDPETEVEDAPDPGED